MPRPLFAPPSSLTEGIQANLSSADAQNRAFKRGREAAALVLIASSVFIALALASFASDPDVPEVVGPDWVGPVGAGIARFFVSSIGVVAWTVPAELLLIALPLFRDRPSIANVARIAGDMIVIFIVAALIQVSFPNATAFGAMPAAGAVGELFGELMRSLFSTIGSYIIGLTAVGLIAIARASFSFISFAKRAGATTEHAAKKSADGVRALADAWTRARQLEKQRATEAAQPIPIDTSGSEQAIIAAIDDEVSKAAEQARARQPDTPLGPVVALHPDDPTPTPGLELSGLLTADDTPASPSARPNEPVAPADTAPKRRRRARAKSPAEPAPSEPAAAAVNESIPATHDSPAPPPARPAPKIIEPVIDEPVVVVEPEPSPEPEPVAASHPVAPVDEHDAPEELPPEPEPSPEPQPVAPAPKARAKAGPPKIVDTSSASVVEKPSAPALQPPASSPNSYQLPPFDLLELGDDGRLVIDDELQAQLNENAQQLVTTLSHYGVRGVVREIQPGPTVTTYEMEPEAGIKVSKIAGLADDLAMNLGCQVRIIAPIPGKKRVGFEVPNRTRKTVSLRELIEDRRFQELNSPLPVVLGRDIVGAPFYADLASMPHVLVAGATGAGKSVGLNVMLVSLLYRRSPEEMRLLMIDPKVVELQAFDRMPHMLLPVVTDTRQASNALKWAVDEMERRYQLLANAGTKNIKTYNQWVDKVRRGEIKGYGHAKPTVTTAPDGSVVEFGAEKELPPLPEPLPYIVIVIDEFADLMMQQGKDVEASIARLAQKARAAGMHVILATQRPSVDVITGMIKANFPTRIAFKVTQRIDSRTILDEQGAEHLLGRGDMLVKINGSNDTRRVQCPFVSEEELERVTAFVRMQGEPTYDESILQARDDDGSAPAEEDAEQDPKYDEAVQIVAMTRRCSTSWIQRKLGIGYNRAAKIVEMMEKRGIVGPAQGARDREVLIEPL